MDRLRSCWKAPAAKILRRLLPVLLLSSISPGTQAREANPRQRVAVLSSSRRFVVSGQDKDVCSVWAVWLGEVDERIAGLLGRRPPMAKSSPLRIHLQSSSRSKSPPVFGKQVYVDSMLHQKLYVNLAKDSRPEVLEGLCRLLCNRYLIDRQNHNSRKRRLQRMPDWFSVGVALNLFAEESAVYSQLAFSLWRRGDLASVAESLQMAALPVRTTPRDEALCFAFVRWIDSQAGMSRALDLYLAKFSTGKSFGIEDLMTLIEDVDSRADLEKSWELYVASVGAKTSIRRIPDVVAVRRELDRVLRVLPDQYSVVAGADVALDNLTQHRDQPWIEDLSQRLCARIKALALVPDPQWRELLDQYYRCMETLAADPGSWWQRLLGRKVSDERLDSMIDEAEQRRAELSRRVEEYQAYLDQVEGNVYNQAEKWDYRPTAEESAYVDRIEKKLTGSENNQLIRD